MRLIDRRLGLLFCLFVLLFSVALARAFWLQGVRGGELRAEAHGQQVTEVTIPGQRGRVIDHERGVSVGEQLLTLALGQPRVQRHGDDTATQRAEQQR